MVNYIGSAGVIRKIRIENKLSQAELTQMLGMKNGQYVSNIERGLAKIPAKYVGFLCKKFGVDKNEIIEAIIEDERRRVIYEAEKSIEFGYRKKSGEPVTLDNVEPITRAAAPYSKTRELLSPGVE